MKFNKIWGKTMPIFNLNNVEVHRIEIEKGGYCSKHTHQFKSNMFYIESGILEVRQWQTDSNIIDKTILCSGDQTIVPPSVSHQFFALEDTIAYEIYSVSLDTNDIIRETFGGVTQT
jgi:quercetin dioxygenase-like cupin family protein